MSKQFNEDGTYNKTDWKAGDKITATKLNKIEDAIEAVNNHDISRHQEADARLDALEAGVIANKQEIEAKVDALEDTVVSNKDAADLDIYRIDRHMTLLDKKIDDGVAEVYTVAETVDGKIAKAEADMDAAVAEVYGVAETVDGKIAEAESDMDAAVAEARTIVTKAKVDLGIIEDYFYNVDELKAYKEFCLGQIVATYGYNVVNDNGQAKYKIVTLDEYKEYHPSDIRDVITGADEYGSFSLDNGYIAMLLPGNYTTPEQWGAVGDGLTNNTIPFIHMYAKTKTGTISFRSGATYIFEHTDFINPYKTAMINNPLGGYDTRKPLLANLSNLTLEGNNSTLVVGDNNFNRNDGYDIDMSILQLGGDIDGLTIRGLTINGNGFTQDVSVYKNNNRNHNIAYLTGGSIKNIIIENCTFKEGGCVNSPTINDFGGDGILIIAPEYTENITIRNNRFINVGRWAIAFDLNFNANRIAKNVTIDNNFFEMIAEDSVKEPKTKKERNLGFIDFEIYHSWKNLRITNNTVIAGSVGIAMGGGPEAISENVFIENNNLMSRSEQSTNTNGYYYVMSLYNQNFKNLYIRNNNIQIDDPKSDNLISFASSRDRYIENLIFEDNHVHYNTIKNTNGIDLSNLELKGTFSIRKNIIKAKNGVRISNPVLNDTVTSVYINITNNDFIETSNGYEIKLVDSYNIGCYKCYKFMVLNNLLLNYSLSILDGTFTVRDKTANAIYDSWGNGKLSIGLLPPYNIGGYVIDPRIPANQESTQVIYGKYTQGQDVLISCSDGKYAPTPYKLVCTKSGCGVYSYDNSTYKQINWTANEVNPVYRAHNDKMYLWIGGNVSCGETPPTHSSGVVDNWRYLDEIATFKKVTF